MHLLRICTLNRDEIFKCCFQPKIKGIHYSKIEITVMLNYRNIFMQLKKGAAIIIEQKEREKNLFIQVCKSIANRKQNQCLCISFTENIKEIKLKKFQFMDFF